MNQIPDPNIYPIDGNFFPSAYKVWEADMTPDVRHKLKRKQQVMRIRHRFNELSQAVYFGEWKPGTFS